MKQGFLLVIVTVFVIYSSDSYLEKATQAAQEALDEDMSHHFREAKELYETSIGYMLLVARGILLYSLLLSFSECWIRCQNAEVD